MKYLLLLLVLSFGLNSQADGLANAAGAAAGGGVAYIATATTSSATGLKMMRQYCSSGLGIALCVAGADLIVTAVANALEGDKNKNTADQLSASTPSGPPTTPGYDAVKPYVTAGQQIAAANGTTLQNLAAQAPSGSGTSGSGGGGSGSPGVGVGSGMTPDMKAAIDQAKDAVAASGFKVSSVGTEGGGGGGGARGTANGSNDLDALLASLGKGRAPASVQGLQKSFNGDAIGVAGDNIFTKITQAYQSKITANTFLPSSH